MRKPLLQIAVLSLVALLPLQGATAAVSFSQVAKFAGIDTAAGDGFGDSVSIDGDTLLVGAPFDDDLGAASGSFYVFERDVGGPGAWGQVAKLTAPDGQAADWFGTSVDLDGDTAVVSASVNDFSRIGFAYIFERDAGGPGAWGAVARLQPADGEPFDSFGNFAAISGDTAVVGAGGAKLPGGGGAVYVFERDAGGPGAWGQVDKLTPAAGCEDDMSACGWRNDDGFGASVALNGDMLVVGNSQNSGGFSYVFRRDPAGSWRRVGRPKAADFSGLDSYGGTVAVSGKAVLLGAHRDNDLGIDSGSAYIFTLDPDDRPTWTEAAKLNAPDGEAGDSFGLPVALEGDTAVLGAKRRGLNQGKAYVFRRSSGTAGTWRSVGDLVADDGEDFDELGASVAVSGETVVVSATGDDDFGLNSGSVYVYEATQVASESADSEGGRGGASRDPMGQEERPVAGERSADLPSRSPDKNDLERMGAALLAASPSAASSALSRPRSGSPESVGPFCFEFNQSELSTFCDGLELTATGNTITGSWRTLRFDFGCVDLDVAVSGRLEAGSAFVGCDAESALCPQGLSWGWIIDLPLDGTMTMLQHTGFWNSWIDNMTYISTPGPCP